MGAAGSTDRKVCQCQIEIFNIANTERRQLINKYILKQRYFATESDRSTLVEEVSTAPLDYFFNKNSTTPSLKSLASHSLLKSFSDILTKNLYQTA